MSRCCTMVNCQQWPRFRHLGNIRENNSFIHYDDISEADLKCETNVTCCTNSTIGGWRDGEKAPVYEGADGTSVCMSLEEMELSVYTVRVVVMTTHQDCGDVIYLIPVERCRASTFISAMTHNKVS